MRPGVLVSGASGMVGIALVRYLLDKGYSVVALVREGSVSRLKALVGDPDLSVVPCSMDGYSKLVLKYGDVEFETFYHLAWAGTFGPEREDSELQIRNISSTIDAIRLAHRTGCRTFVGVGSQAEYGIRKDRITEDDPVDPVTGYGIAKYASGKLGKTEAERLGLKFCWARLFSAYGPHGIRQSVLNYTIDSLKAGKSPELGSCTQIWNFVHVDDVASALCSVSRYGKDGKTYNIASATQRRLKDYIEVIHRLLCPDVPIHYDSTKQGYDLIVKPEALMEDTGWKEEVEFDSYFGQVLR